MRREQQDGKNTMEEWKKLRNNNTEQNSKDVRGLETDSHGDLFRRFTSLEDKRPVYFK